MNKEQFKLEFVFDSVSTRSLWKILTTATGLSTWFADEILIKGNAYTFKWHNEEQIADVLIKKPEQQIRFKWRDDDPRYYFEFKIQVNELTGSTLLTLTDFAEKDDVQDAIDLWNNQIDDLQRSLGI